MTTVDQPDRPSQPMSRHPDLPTSSASSAWSGERELIRYVRTRTRILSGLIQPVLFLFVLGYGMSGAGGDRPAASTSGSSCSPASWP